MLATDTQQPPEESPSLAPLWRLVRDLPAARRDLLQRLYARVPSDLARGAVATGLLKNLHENPAFVAWLRRLVTELGDRSVEAFFHNLVVKHAIEGHRTRLACKERHGFFGPHTVVINPTMRCNLRCVGCYADFARAADMDYELLRKVLG